RRERDERDHRRLRGGDRGGTVQRRQQREVVILVVEAGPDARVRVGHAAALKDHRRHGGEQEQDERRPSDAAQARHDCLQHYSTRPRGARFVARGPPGASASIWASARSSEAPPGWKFGSRKIWVTPAAA